MEKIAVYGSGTIGSCEATLIIGHGIPCTVIGHSEKGLERCRKAVAQNWDDLIANGLNHVHINTMNPDACIPKIRRYISARRRASM